MNQRYSPAKAAAQKPDVIRKTPSNATKTRNVNAAMIANAEITVNVKTANAIAAKKPRNANAATNAHAAKTANAKIANAKQAARSNSPR